MLVYLSIHYTPICFKILKTVAKFLSEFKLRQLEKRFNLNIIIRTWELNLSNSTIKSLQKYYIKYKRKSPDLCSFIVTPKNKYLKKLQNVYKNHFKCLKNIKYQ